MNIRYPLLKERIKEIITKEYERLNAGERLDLSPKSIWSKIKDENISKPSDRQLRRYIDEGIKPLLGEGRAKLIIERKPIIISYRRKVLVKGSGIIKSDKCPYCGSKNLRHQSGFKRAICERCWKIISYKQISTT